MAYPIPHHSHSRLHHLLARLAAIGGALALLALALATAAAAQSPRDNPALVARGREVAAGRCARCHSIEKNGESPQRNVVSFRDLPARFPVAMLMEVRSTGIISGHDEMPMTALGRDDVDALLAFIDSFAPAGAPGYVRK